MGVPPDWSSITLADLIPALKDLQDILDAINAGHDALKTSQTQLRNQIDTKINQLDETVNSVVDGLNTLKQNIDSTGVFLLFIPPDPGAGGTTQFVNTLASSIDDLADESRPQFTGTAFVTGFVVLAGAPSLAEAQEVQEKWQSFINFDPVDLPNLAKLIPGA